MSGRHGREAGASGSEEPGAERSHAAGLPLSELTTLRVGGPARAVLEPVSEPELVAAVLEVWRQDADWFVLGGGSNVVIADEGFSGTVIRVATRGIARIVGTAGTVRLRVQAGEPWDSFVSHTVKNGWSGLEALSGIPGSVGASPIQNIGAYGQEAGDAIVSVDFLDYGTGRVERIPRDELGLGYRTSVFKRGKQGVVLSVTFTLVAASPSVSAGRGPADAVPGASAVPAGPNALGQPIAYAQLAAALGVSLGDRVPLGDVRAAVLRLRASKGMVLDPADPDSVSVGSFFTNPVVAENVARSLPAAAPRWLMEPEEAALVVPLPDAGSGLVVDLSGPLPSPDDSARVKLSAAWLIENSGIRRGFALPGSRAAISSKHTLAIVNTGGASAAEVCELARFIQGRVSAEFGIVLAAEPVLLGHSL